MIHPTSDVTQSRPVAGPGARRLPRAVALSITAWLAAILAGVAEALLHLAMPDPPGPQDLAVRFGIYLVLAGLVLALRTGRNGLRWTLAVLLGVFGTLSLVVEPVGWLVAGGDPVAFLTGADGATLGSAALRTVHLVLVGAALWLMFRPAATRFFRGGRG